MSEKLLRHVILFQFKDEATEEQIVEVGQAILAMPAQITEIHQLEWGSAINEGSSYSHCLVVTFRSEADMKAYDDHPAHKALVQPVRAIVVDSCGIDYWASA